MPSDSNWLLVPLRRRPFLGRHGVGVPPMCMRPWFLEGVGALAVGLLVPAASAAGAFSSDEGGSGVLRPRIGGSRLRGHRCGLSRLGVGCVVALVDESGARVVSHGLAKSGERRPVDGDTVFQAG